MSKRKDPVARARGRAAAAPIKKPFPLGFAVGSVALAAALIGILVYAVQNEGVGDKSSLAYAESQFDDLTSLRDIKASHVDGPVAYPGQAAEAPFGGNHAPVWQNCGVYTQPIASEYAVHSLEHGAVWAAYNPATASADDIATLTKLVEKDPLRLLSPYPGLTAKINLVAWGQRIAVDSAKDPKVERFFDLFTNGPQTPERGAACTGGTSATGSIAPAAPAGPAASTSPSPAK
jgi:hypothetical protein